MGRGGMGWHGMAGRGWHGIEISEAFGREFGGGAIVSTYVFDGSFAILLNIAVAGDWAYLLLFSPGSVGLPLLFPNSLIWTAAESTASSPARRACARSGHQTRLLPFAYDTSDNDFFEIELRSSESMRKVNGAVNTDHSKAAGGGIQQHRPHLRPSRKTGDVGVEWNGMPSYPVTPLGGGRHMHEFTHAERTCGRSERRRKEFSVSVLGL